MNDSKPDKKSMTNYLQETFVNDKKEKQQVNKNQFYQKESSQELKNFISLLDQKKSNLKDKKKLQKFKHKKHVSSFPDAINSSIYIPFLDDQDNNQKRKIIKNKSKTIGIDDSFNETEQKRQNKTCVKTIKNRYQNMKKDKNHHQIQQQNLKNHKQLFSERDSDQIDERRRSIQLPLLGNKKQYVNHDVYKKRMKTISQEGKNSKLSHRRQLSIQSQLNNTNKNKIYPKKLKKQDFSKDQQYSNLNLEKKNLRQKKHHENSKNQDHSLQIKDQRTKEKQKDAEKIAYNLRLKLMKLKKKNQDKLQKQWKQIDFFRLKTCFYKIQLQINHAKDGKKIEMFNTQRIVRKKNHINTIVPKKQNISQFIKNYVMLSQTHISINDLVKLPKFGVDFQEKQSLFFGQLSGKVKSGFGIFISKGYSFQGFWQNNQKIEGIQYKDGGTYYGKFSKDKRQGVGRFVWDNGEQYSGEFKNGLKNGTGHWKNMQNDRYIGQWVNGRVEGFGIHTTEQGQKYQGNFVNFLKHGHGKQQFPNLDEFQGEYYEGKPHHKGKYIFKNGVIYQGDFFNGMRHGKGKLKVPNRFIYEGIFKQEQVTGFGKLVYLNGDSYIGQFEDGKKHGKGSMHYRVKNTTLKGIWKNNVYQPISQQLKQDFFQ